MDAAEYERYLNFFEECEQEDNYLINLKYRLILRQFSSKLGVLGLYEQADFYLRKSLDLSKRHEQLVLNDPEKSSSSDFFDKEIAKTLDELGQLWLNRDWEGKPSQVNFIGEIGNFIIEAIERTQGHHTETRARALETSCILNEAMGKTLPTKKVANFMIESVNISTELLGVSDPTTLRRQYRLIQLLTDLEEYDDVEYLFSQIISNSRESLEDNDQERLYYQMSAGFFLFDIKKNYPDAFGCLMEFAIAIEKHNLFDQNNYSMDYVYAVSTAARISENISMPSQTTQELHDEAFNVATKYLSPEEKVYQDAMYYRQLYLNS